MHLSFRVLLKSSQECDHFVNVLQIEIKKATPGNRGRGRGGFFRGGERGGRGRGGNS